MLESVEQLPLQRSFARRKSCAAHADWRAMVRSSMAPRAQHSARQTWRRVPLDWKPRKGAARIKADYIPRVSRGINRRNGYHDLSLGIRASRSLPLLGKQPLMTSVEEIQTDLGVAAERRPSPPAAGGTFASIFQRATAARSYHAWQALFPLPSHSRSKRREHMSKQG